MRLKFKRDGFNFHDDVVMWLIERAPWFRWLTRDGLFGYAWWYLLTHPHKFAGEVYYSLRDVYWRATKGYSRTDTFNVESHLCEHIPALLRELKAWGNGYPSSISWDSHALNTGKEDQDKQLAEWHAILDEIIVGFEAALQMDDCPAWDELQEEWEKRYPGKDYCYLDYDDATNCGIPMRWLPEYDELEKELRVKERREEWRKEKLKLFHRGMYLFHLHFFDLWD